MKLRNKRKLSRIRSYGFGHGADVDASYAAWIADLLTTVYGIDALAQVRRLSIPLYSLAQKDPNAVAILSDGLSRLADIGKRMGR